VILRRDTAPANGTRAGDLSSLTALGRALRRARTRQGLRIDDAAARTGLPAAQLQALESGVVAHLPDGLQTVRTMRRYAAFLGLPADRFTLALVDLWPPGRNSGPAPAHNGTDTRGQTAATDAVTEMAVTSAIAQTTTAGALSPLSQPAAVATPAGLSESLPTDTGVVVLDTGNGQGPKAPDVAAAFPTALPANRAPGAYGAPEETGHLFIADTGVSPAVPGRKYRRHRTLTGLRVLVSLLAILLLVGVAGLVINAEKPQWLAAAHLPHAGYVPNAVSTSTTAGAAPTTTAPPVHPKPAGVAAPTTTAAGHRGATTTARASGTPTTAKTKTSVAAAPTTTAPRRRGTTTTTGPVVVAASTSSYATTFNVKATQFTVTVAAVGGAAWTQVSNAQSPNPVYSGVLNAGQSQTFTAQQSLTVEVGSTAAQLTVNVGGKPAGPPYVPQNAPFTVTYQSVS
jgi:transcriptional regulator with XRE-family HTH domain